MALFKILKGNESNLPTTKTPGYMYITEDQGNIFVDLSTTERIQLNAKNAATSNKWAAPITLSLSGDASGSVNIDGSANANITVTVKDDSHNHVISNIDNLQTTLDSKASKDIATQSANGLMSSTDKTKLDGIAPKATPVYYGECSTAAATAAKVVTVDDSFTLVEGAQVTIKFTNANSVASPTLNVNSTGAKPLYQRGTTAISTSTTTTGWAAGAIQTFTYDGTGWIRDYWVNTTYSPASLGQGYATCSTAETTTAKVATLSSYLLVKGGIVAVKFTYAVPASSTLNVNSKGAKSIYYRGAAIESGIIKAGDIATFIYNGTQYHLIAIDRWQEDTAASINNLSINGKVITYTKNDGTTGTITTQDTNTTSFTITANALDDDVVMLTGQSGTNAVTYTATHALKGPSTTASTTKGATADVTVDAAGESGSIKVPKVTVDKYGHTTGLTEQTLSISIPSAIKNPNALTFGSKTYDGSSAQSITAADLGLASAMKFLGTTTTAITDGATTNPITIGGVNTTAVSGNVVIYGNKEFVFTTGGKWEELGNEGSYKVVQTAVSSPAANGTAVAFIDTIAQDTNGVITATKKTVSTVSQSAAGLMSKDDKIKLDGISAGANAYVLPIASSTLGGVKTTSTVTSTSGLTPTPIINGIPYYKDTTYTLSSFGITATAAELNILDGATITTTELNYLDGVTGNIQTLLNGKAPTSHASSATTYGVASNTLYGHAMASSTIPKANGEAAVGSETAKFARGDHIHPLQTEVETATKDAEGNVISNYISGASVSGQTVTFTRGDGTTFTITTQDTNTNTDTKVTNTLNTTTKAYITGTTSATTNTGTQIFDTGVYLDTTAGTLTATKFNGPLANSLSIFGSTYNGSSAVTIGASGVTAGTYGPSANVTGNNATTIAVPEITVDTYGRVTSVVNRTYTSVNTDTNTDTKVTTSAKTSGTGYVTTCTGATTNGLNYHTSVYVNHATGVLMGAAWNDYAEYRETKMEIEPGRVVIETGNGDLVLSQERMAPAPNVVSDTFGFAIGKTEKCNTPIAVSGRALVYPFEDREIFKAGDAVCAGPEGTVSLMTREEIKEYPDRIIGIVSEIPNYKTWGESDIEVNDRIWIKIK